MLPKIRLGTLSTERGTHLYLLLFKKRVLIFFISYWHRKFLFLVKRSDNPEILVSVKNLLRIGKEQIGVFL